MVPVIKDVMANYACINAGSIGLYVSSVSEELAQAIILKFCICRTKQMNSVQSKDAHWENSVVVQVIGRNYVRFECIQRHLCYVSDLTKIVDAPWAITRVGWFMMKVWVPFWWGEITRLNTLKPEMEKGSQKSVGHVHVHGICQYPAYTKVPELSLGLYIYLKYL